MDGASIHTILMERSKSGGGLFDPATYLIGLYLAEPSRSNLERFVKASILCTIDKARSLQSVIKLESPDSGLSTSPVELGLAQMFAYADSFSDSKSAPRADPQFKQVFTDLVDDETVRLMSVLEEMRAAGAERIESMPDRIQKCRALGELAAQRYIRSSEDEGAEILDEAALHLKEVLEQPVGQRDPFTWLIFGWVNHQRGHKDHAQHSYLQACLAGGADRDVLYYEGTRMLAAIQVENGAPEVAYQTLTKAPGAHLDMSLLFDRMRICAKTERTEEVSEIVSSLSPKWSLSILGMFAEPDLVKCIQAWRPVLETTARATVEETHASIRAWRSSGEQVSRTISAVDVSLQLPEPLLNKISAMEEAVPNLDVFQGGWLKAEADRGIAEVIDGGKRVLLQHTKSLEGEAIGTQNQIDKLKSWRDQNIDAHIARKTEAESAERARLGLDVGDDRAQAGCLMSSGVGCAGYAAYFVTCFLSTTVMMAAGPNTGIGKVLLIALALPIAFGILFLIADGIRRTMAQNELYRQVKELSGEFDAAIEEINQIYRDKLPPLTEELREIRSRKEVAEGTLRQLQSQPATTRDAA